MKKKRQTPNLEDRVIEAVMPSKARQATERSEPTRSGTGTTTGRIRSCYYIPEDHSTFVHGMGYRVAVVFENESGFRLSGDKDWATNPSARRPYFYGPRDVAPSTEGLEEATKACAKVNAERGISEEDAFNIITSSMFAQNRKRR